MKLLIVVLSVLLCSVWSYADDHELELSGHVSAYYQSASNNKDNTNSPELKHDQIEMGLAYLSLSHKILQINLGYGSSATAFSGSSSTTGNLLQAYGKFPLGAVNLEVGKFFTHLGYEGLLATDNTQFTRSLAYDVLETTTHTGARLLWNHDEMNAGFYIYNQVNGQGDIDSNDTMAYGLHCEYTGVKGLGIRINYLMGADGTNGTEDLKTTFTNVNITYTANEMLNFALAYDAKTDQQDILSVTTDMEANSIGFYANYVLPTWGAGLRYEIYDESDSETKFFDSPPSVTDLKINALTLALDYKYSKNQTVRAEYRMDKASSKVYSFGSELKDSISFVTLAFLANF